MNRRAHSLLVLAVVALLADLCYGQTPFQPKGTIIKYDQPIRHVIDPLWPSDMLNWGENIWSDFDWNKVMQSPTIEPNWIIADDFRDPFETPVRTVKWWGSYNPQPGVIQETPTGDHHIAAGAWRRRWIRDLVLRRRAGRPEQSGAV